MAHRPVRRHWLQAKTKCWGKGREGIRAGMGQMVENGEDIVGSPGDKGDKEWVKELIGLL